MWKAQGVVLGVRSPPEGSARIHINQIMPLLSAFLALRFYILVNHWHYTKQHVR